MFRRKRSVGHLIEASAEIQAVVVALDDALSSSLVDGEVHRWLDVMRCLDQGRGPVEVYIVVVCGSNVDCAFAVPLDTLPAASIVTSYAPTERDLGEIFGASESAFAAEAVNVIADELGRLASLTVRSSDVDACGQALAYRGGDLYPAFEVGLDQAPPLVRWPERPPSSAKWAFQYRRLR